MFAVMCLFFFFSSRRRHTRCALVTGVQTCALPILRQVIGNVLDNAAEVSPDWTSFTTSRDGDMQVKSAVLLAGLYAHGETHVHEPHPTRDYSERMLQAFGWPIAFGPGWARLSGGHRLRPTQVQVPADFSSAAFFIEIGRAHV